LDQTPASGTGGTSSSTGGTSSSTGGTSSSTGGTSSSTGGASNTNLEKLLDFYFDKWFLRNKWDCKKAQAACMDYVINAILKLAGGSIGAKRKADNHSVICVGLGSFKTNSGQTSKHGELIKKLVIKVTFNWQF
jgi:hypothetical protein